MPVHSQTRAHSYNLIKIGHINLIAKVHMNVHSLCMCDIFRCNTLYKILLFYSGCIFGIVLRLKACDRDRERTGKYVVRLKVFCISCVFCMHL